MNRKLLALIYNELGILQAAIAAVTQHLRVIAASGNAEAREAAILGALNEANGVAVAASIVRSNFADFDNPAAVDVFPDSVEFATKRLEDSRARLALATSTADKLTEGKNLGVGSDLFRALTGGAGQ